MVDIRWAFIHPFQLRLQRGIEVYLWNLAASLAKQGIKVDIITWDGPLAVPDFVQAAGVQVRKVPSLRYYQSVFCISWYVLWLIKNRYDHVFVHFAGYGEGPSLKFARFFHQTPFSVVFHFPNTLVPHRYQEFKRWHFDRDADPLISVSQATATEVEQWSGRTCEVIGHGVDTLRFKPNRQSRMKVRDNLGITEDSFVLISVAAFEERKGMQWVIQALPQLISQIPDIHYLIVGDGGYRNQFENLVAELGLGSRVHLVGFKQDVEDYLCASDLMLVLSSGEASSISLLEALAVGLPAITSTSPPFDELIRPAFGVQVDEKNTDLVATAIFGLYEDPQKRIQMGLSARDWVSQHHSWEQVANQYRRLMEQ